VHANASRHSNRDYEQIAREILAEVDAVDRQEDELYGEARGDELREEFSTKHGRKRWLHDARHRLEQKRAEEAAAITRSRPARLREAKRRLDEEFGVECTANAAYEAYRERGVAADGRPLGRRPNPYLPPATPAGKVNVTDLDSRTIKAPRGYVQGYNAQAVTNERQIVIAVEVSADSPDFGHLEPMVTAAQDEHERAFSDCRIRAESSGVHQTSPFPPLRNRTTRSGSGVRRVRVKVGERHDGIVSTAVVPFAGAPLGAGRGRLLPIGVSAIDPLEAGRAAHARHAWDDAYEHLRAADVGRPLTPGDLERLAEAARWSRRFPEMLDALERAQGAYEASGEQRNAARLAIELAYMHWERTDDAVAGGWMARATRLLEGADECPEHGRLRLAAAHLLLRQGAVEPSAEVAREVVDVGRRLGDRALEGLGLVNLGHAMIALEKVDEGLRLVDEASALAQTGSLDLDTTGSIFCSSIFACRNTGDWQRAGEWTEASLRWCERNSVSGFPGLCRFHRAEVLRMRGALADAERDAREAIQEMLSSAPRHAPFGFGELGEIQRRRGEREAAAAAFRHCAELGGQPEPGFCLMRAAEGDAAGALRSLRETLVSGDALVREAGALLPACVAVALAAGDVDAAREALAQLEARAAHAPSPAVLAAAATAAGHLALEEGRLGPAIAALRRGIARYFEMHAPYEAARSRLLLARALQAAGDEAAAGLELEAAQATLERLGASMELEPGVSAAAAPAAAALMTFMFTDMVGSTRLLDELGDDGWNELLSCHDAVLREQFLARGGREIKHEGDGFFVAFADAAAAVEAGCAIERALADHRTQGGALPAVRVGIHTASATSRGGDFIGRGVHEAARLTAAARGHEVLVSLQTLDAAGDRFAGSQERELQLRGFRSPMRVLTVPWES
jgi:class 3 adenylate cyclase